MAKGSVRVVVKLLLLMYHIEYGVSFISSHSEQQQQQQEAQELESERKALYNFFTSTLKKSELIWNLSTPTCNWKGVECAGTTHVTHIRLPAQSFIGRIPINTIGLLTKLRVLSLRINRLSGHIPHDFSNLVLLRTLNLGSNQFSGKFPTVIIQLKRLNILDISSNIFYGQIPCGLQELPLLKVIRLENNYFSGFLPGLHLVKSVNFSVANNSLRGGIPFTLSRLAEEAFVGNRLLCDAPLSPCPYDNQSYVSIRIFCPSQPDKPNPPVATLAMSGGGALFLLLFLIILLFPVRRKQRSPTTTTTTTLRSNLNTTRSTDHQQMSEMFIFSDNNPTTGPTWAKGLDVTVLMSGSVLMEMPMAKGNIWTSYKVELPVTDQVVVVKRLLDPEAVASDKQDFANKMGFLGKMKSHPNVMPLRGYCIYNEAYLLIYDFFPAGSLYNRLHRETEVVLEWESRKRIALGVARGLTHLHMVVKLVHGNIKSSNILLLHPDDCRVADFGLTATPPTSYYGPEIRKTRSQAGDVYAFGVLLLELLTGKSPDVVKLPEWVEANSEIWDSKMVHNSNEKSEMVCLLQIARQCTHQVAEERPTMEKVARMIKNMHIGQGDDIHDKAGPAHQDPSHHEICEESLVLSGTPPPPPFTP